MRYKQGTGDPTAFLAFLLNEKLKPGIIFRCVGNRIHILFHMAAVLFALRHKLSLYFKNACARNTVVRTYIIDSLDDPHIIVQLPTPGLFSKLLTGSWMFVLYGNKEGRSHLEVVLNPPDSERPKTDAQKFVKRSSHQVETPADHGEGSSTSAEKRSKRVKKRNVFTRMEAMSGPLRLLTRCVQERLQVRVMTRSAVHVRGICRGYIVAFDKYFNMAMIDVDEIFRRPVNQGKIKSRITHKLLAAQKTLKKEREECLTKWKADQDAKNEDVAVTSSNLQGLSILPDVNVTDLHNILSTVSQMQGSQPASTTATAAVCEQASVSSDTSHPTSSHSQSSKPQSSSTSSATKQESTLSISRCESKDEKEAILQKLSKVSQKKFKQIQSVYEDLKAPLSPFEREALMLGIPDENVDHRHVSQLFIRGENVVMINIIDD